MSKLQKAQPRRGVRGRTRRHDRAGRPLAEAEPRPHRDQRAGPAPAEGLQRRGPHSLHTVAGPVRGHAVPVLPRTAVRGRLSHRPGLPGVQPQDLGRGLRGRRADHPARQPARPHPVPRVLPLLPGVVRRGHPRRARGHSPPEAGRPAVRGRCRPGLRARATARAACGRRGRRTRGPHGRLGSRTEGVHRHRLRGPRDPRRSRDPHDPPIPPPEGGLRARRGAHAAPRDSLRDEPPHGPRLHPGRPAQGLRRRVPRHRHPCLHGPPGPGSGSSGRGARAALPRGRRHGAADLRRVPRGRGRRRRRRHGRRARGPAPRGAGRPPGLPPLEGGDARER